MDRLYLNPSLLEIPVRKTAKPMEGLQAEYGRESNQELIKALEQVLRGRRGGDRPERSGVALRAGESERWISR
jgi:hypothetical protein